MKRLDFNDLVIVMGRDRRNLVEMILWPRFSGKRRQAEQDGLSYERQVWRRRLQI
jgi:hypothetical protein